VHDFQPVTVMQRGDRPEVTRDDFAVQFNRDAVRLHAQLLDKISQRKRRGDRSRVAVDCDFHKERLSTGSSNVEFWNLRTTLFQNLDLSYKAQSLTGLRVFAVPLCNGHLAL
jgi:hypothetical protein